MNIWLTIITIFFLSFEAAASPLKPVKLDSPKATMMSYYHAMQDYSNGLKNEDPELLHRIHDAVRTMDLSEMPSLLRAERGKELAILLKETIDRVIVLDFDMIPEDTQLKRWRLKDTEIVIAKLTSGDGEGDFVFSKSTVERIPEFYKRVANLPYLDSKNQGAGYKPPLHNKWVPEWSKENFLGLKKIQWFGILAAIFLGLLVRKLSEFIIYIFKKFLNKRTELWRYKILSAIEKPVGLLAAAIVWYISIFLLAFQGLVLSLLTGLIQIVLSLSVIWAIYKLSTVLSEFLERMAKKTESELDDQLVPLFSKSIKIFVVVIGFLLTIQNLGFNVMSLLAGLGLGGLAFALAAKDTAANLFGSIMILLDRPFKVGDWIVTSNAEGNIEEVGFRSTRVRTFYNSVISIPNSILANEKIDNMGKRSYRRVRTVLGLTYDTSPEKLEAFLEGIKNIILANKHTRKTGFHVVFNGYGQFSLDILVYFFLDVPDWGQELLNRQNIYLEILKLAKEIDVQFAFPTQSLYVEAFPEKEPLRAEHKYEVHQLKQKAESFGANGANSQPNGAGIFNPPY